MSDMKSTSPKLPPNRHIGILFGIVFGVIAIWPIFFGGKMRIWSILIGIAFLAVTLIRPSLLTPLNRAWMTLGEYLGKVVNPIVLGVLFFLVITPIALVMRWFGRDPLNRRLDSAAASYWIERDPNEADTQSMTHQF